MAEYTGNGMTLSLGGDVIAGLTEFNIDESVEALDVTVAAAVAPTARSFISDGLKNFKGTCTFKMDDAEANYPRAGDSLAGVFQDTNETWTGTMLIQSMAHAVKVGEVTMRTYNIQGTGAFVIS